MSQDTRPVITRIEERPREGWDDPDRGTVGWWTLFSRDRTPTEALTAGIADVVPNAGELKLHRHAQAEIYYVIEGTGILTINGVETVISTGHAAFIPGDAEHGLRNESGAPLRIFYVLPTDSFADVVYRFPE